MKKIAVLATIIVLLSLSATGCSQKKLVERKPGPFQY